MKPDTKTLEQKKLRKYAKEYWELRRSRRNSGTYIDVEPYQQGWVRFYVLRDDIKNRSDAHVIQKALDLVNSRKYSSREDFTENHYRKGRVVGRKPIEQKLRWLTEQEYEKLDERLKSYFHKSIWTEKRTYPTKHYVTITGYVLEDHHRFVFHIEPNMIVQHWIPDAELESRIGEMRSHIERNGLWPAIDRALGLSTGEDRYDGNYRKTKLGHVLIDDREEE